jgi:sigma-54 dependent transcriptional regulator, acetoin dehydrogenase operon transcriptional activator AcoR
MDSRNDRLLAHAQALRARGAALPQEGRPGHEILDSWVRCMQSGLDVAATPTRHVVGAAELSRRRDRAEVVRRLAQAELETLSHQIAGSNFLLAFADTEGVILDLYSDNRFSMSGDNAGIVAGSQWTEALCGTNGLGTALATGRSVAVTGLEHFFFTLGDVSCTATPVRDARGDVVGVLDASSYFESRQRHTQALVQMAATHIENLLLVHQMRARHVLAIHPRAEYLGTLSAGLLAFDRDGMLCAANARARQLLSGLDVDLGACFDTLFGEPFERCLSRLAQQPEVRLRDALGSALVVSWQGRPAPPVRPALGAPASIGRPASAPILQASDIVCDDEAVQQAYSQMAAALRLHVPVLIGGETGTGKELLARHAHRSSGRQGAFVAVNCGALPAELIEAELFGHAPGAYTGARREGSAGLIASADRGTLLLDELGELPLSLQPTLLRFLDDQMVRAVGATQSRQVDVQVLAASHIDLEAAVAAGRFRADLLYRLNVVQLSLPPLRRRSDFVLSVRHVLAAIDPSARIDDAALARLARHGWPGNFRELRAVLTRALLLSGQGRLGLADVEPLLPAAGLADSTGSALQVGATEMVLRSFEQCGRSVSQTSRKLGISRTTVYRHLRAAAEQGLCHKLN